MGADPRDEERERLRSTYFGRGGWPKELDSVLAASPAFLEAYLQMAAVPWRTGELDNVVRELIYVAVDSAMGHGNLAGVRLHTEAALRAGATQAHAVQAVQLACVVGFEASIDALAHLDDREDGPPPDLAVDPIRARYERMRGPWDPRLYRLLRWAPELLEAYVGLLAVVCSGPLRAWERELVALAACSVLTGPGPAAIGAQVHRTLAAGASPAAVVEAVSLAAPIGLHVATDTLPVVLAACGRVERAEGTPIRDTGHTYPDPGGSRRSWR